jgi:hypothetical protein
MDGMDEKLPFPNLDNSKEECNGNNDSQSDRGRYTISVKTLEKVDEVSSQFIKKF